MKNKEKLITINCPHCGWSYLPAEIYLPNTFLGKPSYIEKESNTGNITEFFGNSMNLEECYICDRCNQPFKIFASVQFSTKGIDYTKDYTTKIRKQSLFLNED